MAGFGEDGATGMPEAITSVIKPKPGHGVSLINVIYRHHLFTQQSFREHQIGLTLPGAGDRVTRTHQVLVLIDLTV